MQSNEDPAARARKYILTLTIALRKANARAVNKEVRAASISRVADSVQRYLADAQHYLDQGRAVTALASVAYAEGLLDALTFLELA